MSRSKYPLASLEELRRRKVDESAASLASARAERENAEVEQQRLEAAKRSVEDDAAKVSRAEYDRLVGKGVTAEDLARRYTFEEGARLKANEITTEIDRAKEQVSRTKDLEVEVQSELLSRRAESRVVEKDLEKFRAGVAAKADAADEEEAEEAWRPQKH